MLAGDYYMEMKNWKKASMMYETGLSKVIPTEQEREYMQVNLRRCKEIQE
jgi:predicted negative regulator of RcsB-dependent stress response